ncbi:MAG TPA: hypothetical protein VGK67_23770 [Myxococcales bacterium]|jgi:hypothetical protein
MTSILPLIMAAAVVPLQGAFRSAREYDRPSFRYRPPEAAQLERARQLFAALARALAPGPPPAELVTKAKAAGFELLAGQDAGGEIWIVRELEGHRAGAGFYALRAKGLPVCIQAPHTFFDEGTGDLALATFAALHASCLCTNTVHRRALDVAHAEQSVFLAATEALLEACKWPLVQLHGFAADSQPADVAAVVSEGTQKPNVGVRLQKALRVEPGRVLLYPRDTKELGGTTNVEGSRARAAGVLFLHIEMSPTFREKLLDTSAPLVAALREVLTPP